VVERAERLVSATIRTARSRASWPDEMRPSDCTNSDVRLSGSGAYAQHKQPAMKSFFRRLPIHQIRLHVTTLALLALVLPRVYGSHWS
jgi:hypothetical protein